MKSIIKLFSILLLLSSCSKENQGGVITSLRPLWSSPTSDATIRPSIATPYLPTILGSNNIVVLGYQGGKCNLISFNTNNGQEVWRWRDLAGGAGNIHDLHFMEKPLVKDGILYWSNRRDNYAINLETGKTIWKKYLAGKIISDEVYPYFNDYHLSGVISSSVRSDTLGGGAIWAFENQLGRAFELLKPKYDYSDAAPSTGRCGYVSSVYAFVEKGDTLLSVAFTDPVIANYQFRVLLGLYNQSKKQWIYEREPVNQFTWGLGNSTFEGDKGYFTVGMNATCHDLKNGKKQWSYLAKSTFSQCGLIIQDSKVFGYDNYGMMFCLDKETGREIWKSDIGGNGSQIQYLNGVIYTSTSANLTAVDAETGKELWEVPSPDRKKTNGYFDMYVGVVPGKNGNKGRIIVTTGYNAYCYEAIR